MEPEEIEEVLETAFTENTSFVMVDGQSASQRSATDLMILAGAVASGGENANGGTKSGWNFLRPAYASLPGTGRDT